MNLFTNIRHFLSDLFRKESNDPWLEFYSPEERRIKFTKKTIYEYLRENVKEEYYDYIALNYFNTKISYREMFKNINIAARGLRSLGVKEGDIVSICLPNMPEAIYVFYACNKIGAVADFIHPLSSPEQLKLYLSENQSRVLFLVDFDYDKMKDIIHESKVYRTIMVSPKESMPTLLYAGYTLTRSLTMKKPKFNDSDYMSWTDFYNIGVAYKKEIKTNMKYSDLAVILHSGGTTGSPKGIMISNYNFNAESQQDAVNVYDVRPGDKILTILPIFHGFGLCVCVHTPLCLRVETILMPEYDANRFYKIMKYDRPHVILGVPTLWEGMMNNPRFDDVDMSQFKYIISGGDHLTPAQETRINEFLHKRGCTINIMKGYGMTESVAATCYTFPGANEIGSIGIPMVGNDIKIVNPKSMKEVPLGEEGEIIVNGPTIMMGYLNNKKETEKVIFKDAQGKKWLKTGDIGFMAPTGFIYFTQRLKRMIVVSGFNVYPSQIEDVIASHPAVKQVSVIGIPHKYKMAVPKAYIVLNEDNQEPRSKVRAELKDLCKKKLSVYSQPKDYEFREELPKTLMNKIDYKKLEEENMKNEKN